jgi:hypothetical protein
MAICNGAFPSVVRTDRGLTVSGGRLTLYLIEDHFRAGLSKDDVQEVFGLSDEEINDVTGYIAAHRAEFDAEYDRVLQIAAENRRYWAERNRPRLEEIEHAPKSPEQQAIRQRIEELERQRERA